MTDASLQSANLRRANLARAYLRYTSFGGANLRGALYDRTTRWPAGFDPRAPGAILVSSTR